MLLLAKRRVKWRQKKSKTVVEIRTNFVDKSTKTEEERLPLSIKKEIRVLWNNSNELKGEKTKVSDLYKSRT